MEMPEHLMPRYDYETIEEMEEHFRQAEQFILENGTDEDTQGLKQTNENLQDFLKSIKETSEKTGLDVNALFRSSLASLSYED